MTQHFTHLHLHTDYSLLDGAISVDKLVAFGKQNNFKALAITDHGNVFGAVKFFQACKKAGIKPILGIEAYLTEDVNVKSAEKKYYHLILLVQNDIGYKNLCKLVSFSFQKGFYFKPRIDYAILEKHAEGLIVLSACLGGHIPQLLMQGNEAEAAIRTEWFLRVFGKERFYLEVQPEDQKDQATLNHKLYAWSERFGVELVATGDCHYVSAEDHEAHEVMLSIQTQDKMDNPNRYTFGDCRVYMRTQEEMLRLFKDHESAIWNTGKIADMCSFAFETGKLFFPAFAIPENHTQESFFTELANIGLQTLFDQGRIDQSQRQQYQDRLDLEIKLIVNMGFIGYFLIVSDFIRWSKREGIPVGPGRGSAAGSLVAWALEITNIDPLRYNLLFERFLNPERVTMPDIDIDFCIEGRDAVINYVRNRYGHDKVCHIITFGTLMAKGVLKDVARALNFSFEDSNAITNLIPEQLKITLKEAIEQEPRLKDLIDGNPRVQKLFDLAFRLEGLTRHASKHAAGIVISPEPIDEVLPVYVPAKSDELVAQYAMNELEHIGFLKIDLLGLKNLTLIDKAVLMIKKIHGVSINIDMLPLDDAKSFALICEGKTSGVFQLESSGLKEVLRKLQPDKFEDIIAVNALYRPGPLGSGMVDDFVERRHGRQKIQYLFEELAPILEETYGVIVYQEQVMKIASTIAGYSLGESDILRRAMGKKKADVMAEQRQLFLTRAQERNFDGKKAGELFDLMAYFAGYGFNKSHSAAYALIAYQTAYLKANYPCEFMACLISLEAHDSDKMAFYLQEAKEMKLTILPPDINNSEILFMAAGSSIIFGLQGIKNVGLASLENIVAERQKRPFNDLLDFCMRIDLRTSNKRVIENLVYAGAFDTLAGNRAQKIAEITRVMEIAVELKQQAKTGQMDLFSKRLATPQSLDQAPEPHSFALRDEFDDKEKLNKEKEVIGFYVSSHPLETYGSYISWLSIPSFAQSLAAASASNSEHDSIALGCGLIRSKRIIVTKKGDRMAFVQLEDMNSAAEIILFPKTFAKVEQWLDSHTIFIVRGGVDLTNPILCKIKADLFIPADLFFQEQGAFTKISLVLPPIVDEPMLQSLQNSITPGNTPLEFIFRENNTLVQLATKKKISISTEALQEFEKLAASVKLSL